jgi:DNA-binding response OmpR family regulator
MAEPMKTVAVLVANPALSSILSMTLAGVALLRVRPFETQLALTTYLRLAPADLVVADFDSLPARADRLAADLRADPALASRGVQIIALASAITPEIKLASIHAGIDEIIVKPMSPRYLVERVLARLARPPAPERAGRRPVLRRDWSGFGDNVVPLFRPQPEQAL